MDNRSTLEPSLKAPLNYICYRASEPVEINGRLDKFVWEAVPWTEEFGDIEGEKQPRPPFLTRVKMLWDDDYFYIGARLEEPHIWATLTEHDSVIFQDNDFEVFIDPNGDGQLYSEFEMNALNTTWDLLLIRPYRAGGPPVDGWEIKGIRTGVSIDGKLNDVNHRSNGWSVEI